RAAVGAVEVRPDALAQVGDHLLAEARVRTRGAGLGTCDQALDHAGEEVSVEVDVGRVGVEHLRGLHRNSLPSATLRRTGSDERNVVDARYRRRSPHAGPKGFR